MEAFVQRTSITHKLIASIIATALLFLLQFSSVYFSSQTLLEGLSDFHQMQKFSGSVNRLRQITDALADVLGRSRLNPGELAETRHLFNNVFSQTMTALRDARALDQGDPEYSRFLYQSQDALDRLMVSANRYFSATSQLDAGRELLLTEQFGLDAIESEEKLKLAIENRADLVFKHVYSERYQPLLLAVCVTLIFIALALAAGLTLTRNLSRSIESLIRATRVIAEGNLEIEAPVLSEDEIGTLAHAFNAMTRSLQHSTVSWQYVERIIQSLPDPLFVLAPDGRVRRVNGSAAAILETNHETLIDQRLDFFVGQEKSAIDEDLAALVSGRMVKDRETLLRTASGRIVPVVLSLSLIQERGRSALGIICILRDITERKEAEAEKTRQAEAQKILTEATRLLFESLEFGETIQHVMRAVIPHLGDCCMIQVFKRDGQAEVCEVACSNPASEPRLRQYASNALEGMLYRMLNGNSRLITPSADLGARSGIVTPLLYQNRALGALAVLSTDPSRHYGARDFPLHDEIARRAAIAIENSRLYNEAREAVASRDEFLSIASHELKTPLTSLFLQIQLLHLEIRKGLQSSDGQDQEVIAVSRRVAPLVASCEEQGRKLTALVNELLDLTRIRLGKLELHKERVDLASIVKDVLRRFEGEATQKGVPIFFSSAPPIHGLWDPLRIEQVVSNLISNALKYGDGKPIWVELQNRAPGAEVVLIVRDQGRGIPSDMLDRIFERFERAGASGSKISGLGLGLYICRQIVEAHQGSIRVESAAGQGSKFTVTLPPAIPQSLSSTSAGEPGLQVASPQSQKGDPATGSRVV